MPTGSPRAVLLDAGNTLLCLDFARISALLAGAGVALSASRLARAEYHGRDAINATMTSSAPGTDSSRAFRYFSAILEGAGVDAAAVRPLFDVIREANAREGLWSVVPPGAREALALLKERGIALGVISNADGRVAAQLDGAGLSDLLDFVIDSHQVGIEKPDPRIFRMGLERAGAPAAEAVYVGDMYRIDVLGAREAGLAGVLVDPLMLENVDCPRVRTVAELPALLL